MKLYISIFTNDQNLKYYPSFYYNFTDKNIELNKFTKHNDYFIHNFKEVDYNDFYKIHERFNSWLDSFQDLVIENKNFTEWLQYNNISLWQFIKEAMSWHLRLSVVIIESLLNLIKNTEASEIIYYTNINNTDLLLKEICDKYNKTLRIVNNKKEIKKEIKKSNDYWTNELNFGKRINFKKYIRLKKDRSIKKDSVLFFSLKGKEHIDENNKLKDNYIDNFVNYFSKNNQYSYRVVLPVYPTNKKDFIDKHLEDGYYENVFFDEFLEENEELYNNQLLYDFKIIWDTFYQNEMFKKKFVYQGIDLLNIFYTFLKQRFTTYLVYRIIPALQSARSLLIQFNPKRIFLLDETFDISRAIIIEAQRLGIESIGLQHGAFSKQHWYYLDKNTSSSPSINQKSFYGFVITSKTFVFGQYYKDILSNVGTYNPDSIYVLPNWIINNNIQDLISKNELLKKFKIQNKIILILSGIFIDIYLEQILEKHKDENCTFVLKMHPRKNKYEYLETILKKYPQNYLIITEYYSEFILYSDIIYSSLGSTSVLDTCLLGRKPYVYLKYATVEYPWKELTYSIDSKHDTDKLTKEDLKQLAYISCIGSKKELFENLDIIFSK